ncbi:hypothetical protein SELMODRAFT_422025 [Selaginella moellendorffii]|uniref:BHLH domain-containing protein n=1 Tax=Selaginella moellendorffii TaxID=88036 RepID=D8SH39_SELML|nr:uncharacterized protein LOC9661310 [Selaginella moellendorffii]EFJ16455.1 hypothetical protein SELMODRAFT_422025 [Selaginella moellendorffii]|eukprot:XP_002982702.1 uncharacterized protein LOC9661310 [Selaginella moellendorffii]
MAHNLQEQQQQQLVMDEMMEQILSMPSWSDSGRVAGAAPWDSFSGGMAGLETMVALLNTNNTTTTSSSINNGIISSSSLLDPGSLQVQDHGSTLLSQLKQQQQQEHEHHHHLVHDSCRISSISSNKNNGDSSSPVFERSDSTWCQQYASNLPLSFGKPGGGSGGDVLTEAQMLGKRIRDEQQQQQQQAASLMENLSAISGQDAGIFNTFGGHPGQTNLARTKSGQACQGLRTEIQEVPPPVSQQQPAAAIPGGAARPRVRARRGQATDPHSIAERLRRERIAERMKSLQELVPNSNKTDKASMLDEIIDYVKFLQLQVKVLSMSRLGNAGAVMTDLPPEDSNQFLAALGQNGAQDGIALTERQVAKLMEEDMGSAMQYLQNKGLCLMPIHLASNMSKTSNNSPPPPPPPPPPAQATKARKGVTISSSSAGKPSTVKNADISQS